VSSRRDSQLALARYLRNPESTSPPPGVEPRRLQVYRDLIYNNIEGFISGGFPVLRSLYGDDDWHALVQAFIDGHRCHTPYFLEISQEFVAFVMNRYQPRDTDPDFLAELAHYEWVELALDVAEAQVPPPAPALSPEAMQAAVPRLSELAWVLSYRFPVHHIGPGFRPDEPGDPCFLLVYRDRDDDVCFVELNAATARLLELVRENESQTALELLNRLAGELRMSPEPLVEFGTRQLIEFTEQSILLT
jgi:hypothetical protein